MKSRKSEIFGKLKNPLGFSTKLIIILLFMIPLVFASYSTDRTDYYNDGTFYVTSLIDDDKDISGNTAVNGQQIDNGADWVVTGDSGGEPLFTNGFSFKGNNFAIDSVDTAKNYDATYTLATPNSSFLGQVGFSVYDVSGTHYSYVRVTDTSDVTYTICHDTRDSGADWSTDCHNTKCTLHTINAVTNGYQDIIFNFTSGGNLVAYIGNVSCEDWTGVTGLKSIQFTTLGREVGNKWYLGDIWIANDERPQEAVIPPTVLPVNITNPLNDTSQTADPLEIQFNVTFDFQQCILMSNLTGTFKGVANLTNFTAGYSFHNPLAYYDFEENTGTTVFDRSVNNFDGQNIGTASYVASKGSNGTGSYALDFDGVSDYIRIPDHDDLTLGDGSDDEPFSLSVWVYMHDASTFRIGGKRAGVSPTEWFLTVDGSDYLRGQIYDESTGAYIGRTTDTTLTAYENTWTHIVMSYEGNEISTGIKFYINGVSTGLLLTESGSYTAMENTVSDMEIGSINNGTTLADGYIDEFALFRYELSQENVTKIYNDGLNVTESFFTNFSAGNYSLFHDLPPNTRTDIAYFVNCSPNVSQTVIYHYDNDITPPEFNIFPANETHSNNNLQVNISTNEIANCTINNTAFIKSFDNGTYFIFDESGLDNDQYILLITCNDLILNSDSKIWNLTKDKLTPDIIWFNPLDTNTSTANINETMTLSITGDDVNLFAYEILVYDDNGDLRHNFTNDNLPKGVYNVQENIIPDRLGNWTVISSFSDSHTQREWDKYEKVKIEKLDRKILFKLPKPKKEWKKDNVSIEYTGNFRVSNTRTKKLTDRYTFSYDFDIDKKDNTDTTYKHSFKVACDNILYLPDSEYTAHFICNNLYWVDFNSIDVLDYDVSECGYNCFTVDMVTNAKDSLDFNSIGGLNINTEHAQFEVIIPVIPSKSLLIDFDITQLENVIILFILVLLFLGAYIIGFVFNNMGFVSFGWFIGLVIGFLVVSFGFILMGVFWLLNTAILISYVRFRNK